VSTTNGAKAVWAELSGQAHEGPSAPTIVIGHEQPPLPGELLRVLDLPVRAAVASGIQTDEATREAQLEALTQPRSEETDRLLHLLDESAPVRLAGRFTALRAAANDQERFNLDIVVSDRSMAAVGELSQLLARLPPGTGRTLEDDVAAFRQWLAEETRSQRRGNHPRPCPLPS
jgi:hypothetical protein